MVTIQRAPWRRALPLVIGASLALGFCVVQLVGIFADLDGAFVMVWVGGTVLAGSLLVGGLHLAYRPFAVDPAAGTVRIGRRELRIDSMREATRSYSGASNGAAYLTYRFISTSGATVRVLVAGRPLPGLDEAGRAALVRFLELAPIAGPARPGEAARDSLASDILADGKKIPVSAAALLGELRGADPAPTAAGMSDPDATMPSATATDFDLAAAQADDIAALDLLHRTSPGLRLARRVAGLVFGLSTAAFVVLAAITLVANWIGNDIDDIPGIGTIIMSSLGVVGATGLGWSILSDLDTRDVRAAGRRWLETADPASRARGLPTPFQQAWLQFAPGHRILTVAAFSAAVLGVLLVLGGPIAMTTGYPAAGLVTIPGLALLGFAIWFWIAHRRRRRDDIAWVIEAAGPRVGRG